MRLLTTFIGCLLFCLPTLAEEPEYINDEIIRQAIEQQGASLVEAGQTTPNNTLQEQLGKEATYQAKLPPEFTLTENGKNLYETAGDGVLVISQLYLCGQCDKLHGNNASGFVISKDGLAITNHHVIQSNDALTNTVVAMTRDGKTYPVIEVLASSKKHDLALIRLDVGEDELTALPIARDAQVGEDVHVISHPQGRFYEYSRGHIGRFCLSPHNQDTPRISVTSHYGGGSSGAPIFNNKGQVVAVVSEADVVNDLKIVFYDSVPYTLILELFKAVGEEQQD